MSFYRRRFSSQKPDSATSLSLQEAKKRLMDYVAKRDHTEKELRKKLALRCTPEIVEQTIAWAAAQNWLASPEKLKEQFAAQLSRRGKGIRKINQKLQEVGLEKVKANPDE